MGKTEREPKEVWVLLRRPREDGRTLLWVWELALECAFADETAAEFSMLAWNEALQKAGEPPDELVVRRLAVRG